MNCERHDLPLPCEECAVDLERVARSNRGRTPNLYDESLATEEHPAEDVLAEELTDAA